MFVFPSFARRSVISRIVAVAVLTGGADLFAQFEAEPPAPPVPAVEPADEDADNGIVPAPEPVPAADDAPNDPLGRAVRNLFDRKRNRPFQMPDRPAREPKKVKVTRELDHIDARAPHAVDEGKTLLEAEEYLEQGEYAEAMPRIESLLRTPVGLVIRTNDDSLVLTHEAANLLLNRMPEDLRRRYRDTADQVARRRLDDAIADRSWFALTEVALRYLHTTPGWQAADLLASLHLDRREYGPALWWMDLIVEVHPLPTHTPAFLLRYAQVLDRTGYLDRRDRVLTQLEQRLPRGTLPIGPDGEELAPRKWLASLPKLDTPGGRVLTEWPMIGGDPTHSAIVADRTPLVLDRWRKRFGGIRSIDQQVNRLVEDLRMAGPTVPAWRPLVVGDRIISRNFGGVSVYDAETGRELWRNEETVTPNRIMLGLPPANTRELDLWRDQDRNYQPYTPGVGDEHPLSGLLFRDRNYGQLSSDGTRLFVLEDHAVMSQYMPGHIDSDESANDNDNYWRDWGSNSLAAYDLETGQLRWRAGGRDTGEVLDSPLAGVFFFGTPIASRGELFAIGERGKEVFLFVMEADTGRLLWSTLLGYASEAIERDFFRRNWSAPVAISQGLIVCPTTLGWMMAVDRQSRTIQWAARYRAPEKLEPWERDRREAYVEYSPLGSVSASQAPVVVGSRVLMMPPEEELLVCLNLITGEVMWRVARGEMILMAGIHDGKLLCLGEESMTLVDLADGEMGQFTSYPGNAKLAGSPVLTPERVFVPISQGSFREGILLYQLDGLRYERQIPFPDDERMLGNLLLLPDRLLSLSPHGLVSLELESNLKRRILTLSTADPDDPWPLLKRAEIQRQRGELDKALKLLRQIESSRLTTETRAEYRGLKRSVLQQILRSRLAAEQQRTSTETEEDPDPFTNQPATDPAELPAGDEGSEDIGETNPKLGDADAELFAMLKELRSLSDSTADQYAAESLGLQFLFARERYAGIHQRLKELTATTDLTATVAGLRSGTDLRGSVWLGTMWGRLYREADEPIREDITRLVTEALAGDSSETDPKLVIERMRLWAFHPAAEGFVLDQIEAGGIFDPSQTELLLWRSLHGTDDAAFARAARLYTRMLLDDGNPEDASRFVDWVRTRGPARAKMNEADEKPSEATSDLKTLAENIATELDVPTWKDGSTASPGVAEAYWVRSNLGTYYYHDRPERRAVVPQPAWLPSMRDSRWTVLDGEQLARSRGETTGADWLIPLPPAIDDLYEETAKILTVGRQMFVFNRGTLQAIDPVHRTVRWRQEVDSRLHDYRHLDSYSRTVPLATAGDFAGEYDNSVPGRSVGMFPVANSRAVVLYGHRSFSVYDSLTGDHLWTRKNCPSYFQILATEDYLFYQDYSGMRLDPFGGPHEFSRHEIGTPHVTGHRSPIGVRVFGLTDGQPIELPTGAIQNERKADDNGEGYFDRTIAVSGRYLITLTEKQRRSFLGLTKPKLWLRAEDPFTGRTLWSREAPGRTRAALLPDDRLLLIDHNGKVSRIDLHSNHEVALGTFPKYDPNRIGDAVVMADGDRAFVVTNLSRNRNYEWDDHGFESEYLAGEITAFDLGGAGFLWTRSIENPWFISEQLERLPFLIAMRRRYVQPEENIGYYIAHITMIDKATGKLLVDEKIPGGGSSFNGMQWNHRNGFLDLTSSMARLRIYYRQVGTRFNREPLAAPRP